MSHLPVTIDGREFAVRVGGIQRQTGDALRQQGDTGGEFGEQSLSPDDLWRRSATDWRRGAGQVWADKDEEDREERGRFAASSGVNVWNRGQVELLRDVDVYARGAFADGTQGLAGEGRQLRRGEQLVVVKNISPDSIHFLGGTPLAIQSSALCPGTVKWLTGDGLDRVFGLTTSSTIFNEDGVAVGEVSGADRIWFAKGRLFASIGHRFVNVLDAGNDDLTPADVVPGGGAATADVPTVVAESDTAVYVSVERGGSGLIYSTRLKEDGTGMEVLTQAAVLPPGEVVRSMAFYQGVLFVGTTAGVRLTLEQPNGLTFGPALPVGPVTALLGADRFMFVGGKGKLWRLDLSTFLSDLQPAYAADLELPVEEQITLITTIDAPAGVPVDDPAIGSDGVSERRLVVMTNTGLVVAQSANMRTSGWVRSARLTWSLPDPKQVERVQLRCLPLFPQEELRWSVEVDGRQVSGDVEEGIGTRPEGVVGLVGDSAEMTVELRGPGSSSPTLTRWTLRAQPLPRRNREWLLPLQIRETVRSVSGGEIHGDPAAMLEHLEALEVGSQLIDFEVFGLRAKGYVARLGLADLEVDRRGRLVGEASVIIRSFPLE